MDTNPTAGARDYAIRIDYLSDGERFATETFQLSIAEHEDINSIALKLATDSTYCNERVPALTCLFTIHSADPDGPDGAPPGAGSVLIYSVEPFDQGGAKPITAPVAPQCPKCGHTDITRDASARWDRANQCWSLSTVYDNQTCENCGAEGNDLAVWVSLEPADRSDFLRAVAEKLKDPTLPEDPVFQLVIGAVHGTMTVDEAAREWVVANDIPE